MIENENRRNWNTYFKLSVIQDFLLMFNRCYRSIFRDIQLLVYVIKKSQPDPAQISAGKAKLKKTVNKMPLNF